MIRFFIYILLTLILGACASQQSEIGKQSNSDSIDNYNQFEADPTKLIDTSIASNQLNNEQLRVFEKVAQQKVDDLIDYLQIISNTKYDKELRKNTLRLADSLFISNTSLIKNRFLSSEAILATDYLQLIYKEEMKLDLLPLVEFKIDSSFYQQLENAYATTFSSKMDQSIKVEVILEKRDKAMGNSNSFTIWKVRLGNIY